MSLKDHSVPSISIIRNRKVHLISVKWVHACCMPTPSPQIVTGTKLVRAHCAGARPIFLFLQSASPSSQAFSPWSEQVVIIQATSASEDAGIGSEGGGQASKTVRLRDTDLYGSPFEPHRVIKAHPGRIERSERRGRPPCLPANEPSVVIKARIKSPNGVGSSPFWPHLCPVLSTCH
jgi:hypothetical protein